MINAVNYHYPSAWRTSQGMPNKKAVAELIFQIANLATTEIKARSGLQVKVRDHIINNLQMDEASILEGGTIEIKFHLTHLPMIAPVLMDKEIIRQLLDYTAGVISFDNRNQRCEIRFEKNPVIEIYLQRVEAEAGARKIMSGTSPAEKIAAAVELGRLIEESQHASVWEMASLALMTAFINDHDQVVRENAAQALAKLHNAVVSGRKQYEQLIDPLAKNMYILTDPTHALCSRVSNFFCEYFTNEERDPKMLVVLAECLVELKSGGYVEAERLLSQIDHSDPAVRVAVIAAVGELSEKVPHIRQLLEKCDDPDLAVQVRAINSVRQMVLRNQMERLAIAKGMTINQDVMNQWGKMVEVEKETAEVFARLSRSSQPEVKKAALQAVTEFNKIFICMCTAKLDSEKN